MKKKILSTLCAFLFIFSQIVVVNAANSTVVSFEGDSNKFMTVEGDTPGFEDMLPGEERAVSITLKNSNATPMSFYMSTEVLDNIAAKTTGDAVYDFSISKNGTTFFSTIIGSDTNTIGKEYLTSDNQVLIDTLKQDESSDIKIVLKLDGDSSENSYMNQDGVIKLVFSAGTPVAQDITPTTTNPIIHTITQIINTGDSSTLLYAGIGLVGSLVLIAFLVCKKKKGDSHDNQ